jgi:hypothetical protein
VAVVVTVPSAVSALKVKVATLKAVMSATPKALRPVANAQHAASVQSVANAMWNNAVKAVAARVAVKVALHVKTATAVDAAKAVMVKLVMVKLVMVKSVMPKAKPPSTTTPHLKLKQKLAPKPATNAWPAKSVAKAPKAATTNANLAVNVQSAANAVKVAKAVANAAHAASAMMVAVNAPHV